MQILDDKYPNLFAVGDIADTGAQKAARPGAAQAAVVAKNIQSLIEGKVPENKFTWGASGIHLTLGLVSQATADNCEACIDSSDRNSISNSAIPT